MIWVLASVGVFAGLVMLIAAAGSLLPKEHVASRTLKLSQPPEAVWQAITDRPSQPSWRSDLKIIERFPDRNGHEVWQEVSQRGDRLTLEAMESIPPRRLVTRIADEDLPFGGRWEYEITPAASGCHLTITEIGEIYNPIFRFIGRFVIGHAATIEQYLRALAAKFGEPAAMQ
jgi:hypothetical protein